MFSEEYNLYFLEKIKCPKTEEEYDNRDIFKDKIIWYFLFLKQIILKLDQEYFKKLNFLIIPKIKILN